MATLVSPGPRRLGLPVRARVRASEGDGRPLAVDSSDVDAVRESWLVEDRWWTEEPLRRRYWEVVTRDGRNLVVFRELTEGRWYRQG
jgi:CO dehydrogenase/acetyl-CoA synthase delta subunit